MLSSNTRHLLTSTIKNIAIKLLLLFLSHTFSTFIHTEGGHKTAGRYFEAHLVSSMLSLLDEIVVKANASYLHVPYMHKSCRVSVAFNLQHRRHGNLWEQDQSTQGPDSVCSHYSLDREELQEIINSTQLTSSQLTILHAHANITITTLM